MGKNSCAHSATTLTLCVLLKMYLTTIVDYSIQNDRFGLVLQGHCNKCGGSVARFVENNELVSAANQLKLTAADGKKYRTDTFDYDGIIELAKNFPGKQANRFIEWFSYSDETIDGAFFA